MSSWCRLAVAGGWWWNSTAMPVSSCGTPSTQASQRNDAATGVSWYEVFFEIAGLGPHARQQLPRPCTAPVRHVSETGQSASGRVAGGEAPHKTCQHSQQRAWRRMAGCCRLSACLGTSPCMPVRRWFEDRSRAAMHQRAAAIFGCARANSKHRPACCQLLHRMPLTLRVLLASCRAGLPKGFFQKALVAPLQALQNTQAAPWRPLTCLWVTRTVECDASCCSPLRTTTMYYVL